MSNPPPRAPTFPKFIDQQGAADESDLLTTPTAKAPPAMNDTSSVSSSVANGGAVPVVDLPVSGRKSVIGRIILWRDVKLTAIYFAVCMLFFYMTLIRGDNVLSVLGFLLTSFQLAGMALIQLNKRVLHNPKISAHTTRPEDPNSLLLTYDMVNRVTAVAVDEINDVRHTLRDFMYCDKPLKNTACAIAGFVLHVLGKNFSFLWLMFVGTLLLFTVPVAYDKNKKQVDDTLAKASDSVVKQVEIGQRMASEKTAELLEKAPPAARDLAVRVGLTPQKSKAS